VSRTSYGKTAYGYSARRTGSPYADGRRTYTGNGRGRDGYRGSYVYGSAALDDEHYEQRRERRRQSAAVPARREEHEQSASVFSVFLALFMMILLTVSVIGYVQLMSNVTVTSNNISSLETQIKNLKTENDQKYEEITSSINLDEIKEVAINELGMKYADSDQIVTYNNDSDDYVHQVQEVGK